MKEGEEPKEYGRYWCEYIDYLSHMVRHKLYFDPMWGWCGDFDDYDRPCLILDNCIIRWAN